MPSSYCQQLAGLYDSDPESDPAIADEAGQQRVTVADANAAWLLKRERRCDQKGRGSIYDSTAGMVCLHVATTSGNVTFSQQMQSSCGKSFAVALVMFNNCPYTTLFGTRLCCMGAAAVTTAHMLLSALTKMGHARSAYMCFVEREAVACEP